MKQLYDSAGKYKETVNRVVTKIFSNKFPRPLEEVTIDNLLDWDLWPICITIQSTFVVNKFYKCQTHGYSALMDIVLDKGEGVIQ